jgi:hypothetical protein
VTLSRSGGAKYAFGSELLEFLHRDSLLFCGGMNISHRHLNTGMPEQRTKGREVGSGGNSSGRKCVAQIVQPAGLG